MLEKGLPSFVSLSITLPFKDWLNPIKENNDEKITNLNAIMLQI
jgi:hypothetical protein